MVDNFASYGDGLDAPAHSAFAITPSDTVDLAIDTRAIYVGAVGDIKVNMVGSGTVTFTAVPQGTVLPIRASRVYATGTTATTLIGVY
jgi:hypothetical protein